MLSLQIILTEKSLIIKLFSLKISYKQNQDTEVNWKIFTWKEGKRRLCECEIVLIFFGQNMKMRSKRSEAKNYLSDKIQSLFTWLCKKGKRRLGGCEIVLIFFRANHENEVEAQRSEKLPIKQKCQSLFTWLCKKYCTGYKNSIENNRWF